MFKYLMMLNVIGGFFMTIFSFYEKDFQNCVNQHGEEFAKKRKKILRILGPILIVFPSIALILDYFFGG